jgi:capsular exopolysaccharide synthesis family protein
MMRTILLGMMAGIGAALLRDRFDHVFHDTKELSAALETPLLGIVPHLPPTDTPTISKILEALGGAERFAVKESLRNLFANFRLLRADKPVRMVAITSSTQGEGKSTSSCLFAQTLSQMGRRVLLVDADMRRPRLHSYLGSDNVAGLSNLLTDPQLSVVSVINEVLPNLDLISAGPPPPDPSQLLSSARCSDVVDEIRQLPGYDMVIFDTPPALLLSDAVLLADHLDGLIFVVGLSRVNRDLPPQALRRMKGTGVDVLGVLANQPVRSRSIVSSGGYGGYGGYGDYAEFESHSTSLDSSESELASLDASPVDFSPHPPNVTSPPLLARLKTKSLRLLPWRFVRR